RGATHALWGSLFVHFGSRERTSLSSSLYNVEQHFRVSPRLGPGDHAPIPGDQTLIAVAGPTASGKSELALRIAEGGGGEIGNCDPLRVYRGFDIGTAKLPESARRGIPHHLIDIADPDELFTAGEFARRARRVIGEIAGRGRLPILAGGTGF